VGEYSPTPPSERGDPVGGTPAQERSLRAQGKKTVNRLLEAGLDVFGTRGYHATRVDDIVKAAKTSHGTFYLYFSNKEDLLASLITHCAEEMEALFETLGEVTPDEAGRAELREWLGRFASLYEHYGPVIRAWAEVAETVNPAFAERGVEILGNFTVNLAKRIEKASTNGSLDPNLAAVSLVAMLERIFYFVFSRQVDFDLDALLDTLASIAHVGVFAGNR